MPTSSSAPGSLWRSLGRKDEARQQFEHALGANPRSANAYYGRAALHRFVAVVEHRPEEVALARADLEKAAAIDANLPHVRRALADLDAVAELARKR